MSAGVRAVPVTGGEGEEVAGEGQQGEARAGDVENSPGPSAATCPVSL